VKLNLGISQDNPILKTVYFLNLILRSFSLAAVSPFMIRPTLQGTYFRVKCIMDQQFYYASPLSLSTSNVL
jgi:hypothetical protein